MKIAPIKCGRPRKGEESQSRDRLLDTAYRLFLEYGYGNLCLETIAKEARVSMRTIYSQFGGKAGLFGAVIKRCSDPFVTALTEDPSLGLPEERLFAFCQAVFIRRYAARFSAYPSHFNRRSVAIS